jgi:hypothetical protein
MMHIIIRTQDCFIPPRSIAISNPIAPVIAKVTANWKVSDLRDKLAKPLGARYGTLPQILHTRISHSAIKRVIVVLTFRQESYCPP